jgi:hypothetical protein
MAISVYKTSLKQHRPNRFLWNPGLRKCMAFRQLERDLHRHLQNRFLRRTGGRLWVLRHICLLKTSLKRLRPSRFFRCPRSTKWVRMAFRLFKTSLHRLRQSRFLRRSKGKIWIFRPIRLLKTSLKRLWQIRFFWMPRIKKMNSHGIWTPWNIFSTTSPKSFIKTTRRQIKSPQGSSPT